MIKTRVWICLLGGLLLASLALLLWPQERAQSAEIWSDGVLVRRVSLAQDQSFTVDSPYGSNTVTIQNGAIAVTQSDCPGIVHRIDKDTSGLLVVAKNDLAHTVLASQLKDHTLARTYEAVVCGNLKEDRGTVDAPIGRHPSDRKRMTVTDRGKEAVTHWEAVTRYRGYTHIRCHLETGRTHQIRVHMAYIGHPILGDTVYGRKKPELGQESQCLHASTLCFRHPRTGLPVIVSTPLPPYFQEVLEKLERMGR